MLRTQQVNDIYKLMTNIYVEPALMGSIEMLVSLAPTRKNEVSETSYFLR
jgi:hypothetical protein